MTPTPEQEAILAEIKQSKQSLLINALAGAAKTTTLCLVAKKLPLLPTISVAFNKRIADEMKARLPGHIESMTLNSLGHRVWSARIGKRLIVNTDKMYEILKRIGDTVPGHEKEKWGEMFTSLLRAVRLAKSAGYVPAAFSTMGRSLVTDHELAELLAPQCDVNPDAEFLGYLDRALELSISDAFESRIDFDDQIYMSTLFGGVYPQYPIVMVDEAQDLSPLNHASLSLLLKPGGRLIAVGDPFQAIYAFRGAKIGSMAALKETFAMAEMGLSVSFRCPRAVVERARLHVPHMQYPEWAVEGLVRPISGEELDPAKFPDGSFIICRNNAPLFRAAMWLIRNNRSIKLVGSDIGGALVKLMRKLGPADTASDVAQELVRRWCDTELAKAHRGRVASIHDRAECMKTFLRESATLGEAVLRAESLFSQSGTIKLMTGHKSKGDETDTVYHLDSFLVPGKWARAAAELGDDSQLEQELNLRYVIETRAKKELFFIESEDME